MFTEPNPVTGRVEPYYPRTKRAVKFYTVTVPVVLLSVSGAVALMMLYFLCQGAVNRCVLAKLEGVWSILPLAPWRRS